jgi:hypothetical protein
MKPIPASPCHTAEEFVARYLQALESIRRERRDRQRAYRQRRRRNREIPDPRTSA